MANYNPLKDKNGQVIGYEDNVKGMSVKLNKPMSEADFNAKYNPPSYNIGFNQNQFSLSNVGGTKTPPSTITSPSGKKVNVQKEAVDTVVNSGNYDMNDPNQKSEAFAMAKILEQQMTGLAKGIGDTYKTTTKNVGYDIYTKNRDEATATYFKLLSTPSNALAEIQKKFDYTSDVDKAVDALRQKKATVASDVFAQMEARAGKGNVNYLEAEKLISQQESMYDSMINNLYNIRDKRETAVLDYAKGVEDQRTKQLTGAKEMIDFWDKKVTEAYKMVQDGVANYKWLADTISQKEKAIQDYDIKSKEMGIKQNELQIKLNDAGVGQLKFSNGSIVGTGVTSAYGNEVKLNSEVADGFKSAVSELKDMGINLVVGDSYRSTQAQAKAYNSGKAGVAPPGSSFHELGQAFDIAQSDYNKKHINEIKAVMSKYGFTQHPGEWWHFSLGEFNNPQKQMIANWAEKSVADLQQKGFSSAEARALLNSQTKNKYEDVIAGVIADKYKVDNGLVSLKSGFDNLLNLDIKGLSQSQVDQKVLESISPAIDKALKLSSDGYNDAERQQILAEYMISNYVDPNAGPSDNGLVISKVMRLFPKVSQDDIASYVEKVLPNDTFNMRKKFWVSPYEDAFSKAQEYYNSNISK